MRFVNMMSTLKGLNKKKAAGGGLAAIVGTAAAAMLLQVVPVFEGKVLHGYLDAVGVPTKCYGSTTDVEVGKLYTNAECQKSLNDELEKHAGPVLECTPQLRGHTYQLVAAVSFAYNVGTHAYCHSSVARAFRRGDWETACERMNEKPSGEPQWIYADGKPLPGLIKRRARERAICETQLPSS